MYRITYHYKNKANHTQEISLKNLYLLLKTKPYIISLEHQSSKGIVDLTAEAKECVKLRSQYSDINSAPEDIYRYYLNNWMCIYYHENANSI